MSHAPQSRPTEVAPGIHRFTGGVSNFYLVEQPGGLTLVDAGHARGLAVVPANARHARASPGRPGRGGIDPRPP